MPYFRAFAARGTAVMTEKPFALSREEHRSIEALFAPHQLACGYQRRNYAATRLVQKLLAERWFGPPVGIRIGEGDRVKQSGTDVSHLDDLRSAGGGVLISQGCHSIDWLLFVTQAEAFEVADVDFVFDGELDRKFSARMRLDGNCGPVDVDCCVSWLDAQPNRIEILFENAHLSLGVGPDATLDVRSHAPGAPSAQLAAQLPGMATTMNQAFYLEWSQFLEGLAKQEPSLMSAAASQATTALIEELYGKGRAS
jgi:predicted dehydrogenase